MSADVRKWWDADEVREAARNRWPAVLGRLGVRAELLVGSHGPCPGCGGRDRFRFDDQEGNGTFICSQGSGDLLSGDGISLLMHVRGCEWKEAVNVLGADLIPEKARHSQGSGLPGSGGSRGGAEARSEVPAPEAPAGPKRLEFDLGALKRMYRGDILATREWFRGRSPVPVLGLSAAGYLEALYRKGEKVLVFTDERSQGQYIYWVGRGTFRLAERPGVAAVSAQLPTGGDRGVWYLCQPVTGEWHANPRAPRLGNGEMRFSRRSKESVDAWRYLVLESDEAPEELWLNLLAQIPLPIAAIYSSGGRSIHALVAVNATSKEQWDAWKGKIAPLFTRLGADPGALSAVRLTRLPGCQRGRDLQELLYLNPSPCPGGLPICVQEVPVVVSDAL